MFLIQQHFIKVTADGKALMNNHNLICKRCNYLSMVYTQSWFNWSWLCFYQTDQRNPWIKDQLGNALLSTILHLQLPNFVSCGRDKPSHMTQNLVTVGTKLSLGCLDLSTQTQAVLGQCTEGKNQQGKAFCKSLLRTVDRGELFTRLCQNIFD